MPNVGHKTGPRECASRGAGARHLSPEHLERLRAIVHRAGTRRRARTLLGTSVDVLEDALTKGKLRGDTADRLEAAIDRVGRELGEHQEGKGAA